jgi:hypothetical protein
MPQCSDSGPGWTGTWPNCTYSAPSLDPTVEGLGFGGLLPAGEDWGMYFDPYDPTRQLMAETGAGIDIGQLQDVWSLQEQQLGEAYGLKTGQLGESWQQRRGDLGAEAGLGFRNVFGKGSEARRKSGMAFSGGAEEMQRIGMEDVRGAYGRAFGLGQTAYEQALESAGMGYEQALETGELGLTQATTDIFQGLEEDIYGYYEKWRGEQRSTLNVLLGSDIWGEGGRQTGAGGGQEEWEEQNQVTCCDGSTQMLANLCGVGNRPWECGNGDGNGGNGGGGDMNPCPDPNNSFQCPDGSCVSSFLQCTEPAPGGTTTTSTGGGTAGAAESGGFGPGVKQYLGSRRSY